MSLDISSSHIAQTKVEKETDSARSGLPSKTSSAPLQTGTELYTRRASVHSIQSFTSTFQSLFFPSQQPAGACPTPNQRDETPIMASELERSTSLSGEQKNKVPESWSPPVQGFSRNSALRLSKVESLKDQKKQYRHEKKRAAEELLSTLKDPSIVIITDWLKVRSSLKTWMKLWCVLKPGLIVLYKSNKSKSSHWVGTILLNACEILERPSKKDGFCFKVFHPLEQSIWATKGPKGENIGAITQPLPYSYLIFRTPSEAAGKCWMDALELALRCSGLLIRTMTKDVRADEVMNSVPATSGENCSSSLEASPIQDKGTNFLAPVPLDLNESDCERHFYFCGIDEDSKTDREERDEGKTDSETEEEDNIKISIDDSCAPDETSYIENAVEELGQPGDSSQTEEVADENKSLIWSLVRQVRPGMDLSRVVLPTFILEPRSFLDKLSDYYYHADLLSEAVLEEDPFTRFKMVVQWYVSGFYKKPKGLKKPYNPILGEIFRCCWVHPKKNSRTFYIAEQISHHPPVSAFYVTNRHDGFVMSGSILAKSKFYGNSLSALLDGVAHLTFLKRGEEYTMTMPYAHCKGILIGTLTMEMGGVVTIHCEKTGYHAELEFKLKPFLGIGEASNRIVGKILLGEETLATLTGRWDQEIFIRDKRSDETQLFWNPTNEIKQKRLQRFTVPTELQADYESERLWHHTSCAIIHGDQTAATTEKFLLEEEQRKAARERKAKMEDWFPKLFERNLITGDWLYKYADLRPWDPMNDIVQFEKNFIIQTKMRHQTPIVHTTNIVNVDEKTRSRSGHLCGTSLDNTRVSRMKRSSMKHLRSVPSRNSASSSSPAPEEEQHKCDSISSLSGGEAARKTDGSVTGLAESRTTSMRRKIEDVLAPLLKAQQETNERLGSLQKQLVCLQNQISYETGYSGLLRGRELLFLTFMMAIQLVFIWWLRN